MVGGAVEDAADAIHPAGSELTHQRSQHGHAGHHGGLEAQVHGGLARRILELPTASRDEVLVGRDDALAGLESGQHGVAGDTGTAHQLDDDVDIVVEQLAEVGHLSHLGGDGQATVPLEVQVGDAHELRDTVSPGGDAGSPPGVEQSLRHGRTDGTQAEQGDARAGRSRPSWKGRHVLGIMIHGPIVAQRLPARVECRQHPPAHPSRP